MEPNPGPPERALADFERRLAGWRPSPGDLDRDRTLFLAGRASVQGSRSPWAVSACSVLLALGLGVLYVQEVGRSRSLAVALRQASSPAIRDLPGARPVTPSPYPVPEPMS